MSKQSKSKGKPEQLSKGTKNQKEIKKYISGLSDLNQELINPIIRTNPDKVTPLLKLKEKFIKEGKDTDFLAAHIEIVDKFQSTNSKKFNKAQLKNVNGYLGVLKRISNGRTFEPTYSEELVLYQLKQQKNLLVLLLEHLKKLLHHLNH
jgi:hypothetical protein